MMMIIYPLTHSLAAYIARISDWWTGT